ncbi:MAG: DUF87 domain-containing protein [Candidatus Aminicenantes bacterium]|nr:DUF87 domain-containing protein [Candidatus Aminicenantes bacterium]
MSDGKFFLGKEVSTKDYELSDENYLYKADHLTTHGMVFGMTGSGKTGLCIDLLEEAIGEDIPLILIDPKGDLANLSLIFPEFAGADFQPWVSPADAAKKGKSLQEYAKDTGKKWQTGLESWGIDKEQVANIKNKADVKIFTPGSSAGMRISILDGFKKPQGDFEDDEENMVEKIRSSVSALLALLDIENDPMKSKPHILIANIIEHYWKLGRDVSIEDLIINIQKPPIQKLGVFELNKLIDEKERTELAFELNNIIASPTFRFWTSGSPLTAASLFRKGENGKVPVNIFYIAHLSDNERMFFVTLLLNEIVSWMRQQPGSGNLKYLVYMDEVFGYLPPYPKNPPSKIPLLTLLKQARAFGLGVVLATQNPKDIDYKALTNMGTWFVGRLQAEGDRERVMDGLTGIIGQSGEEIESSRIEEIITGLTSRKFLAKDVHDKGGLKVFQTRWAMSYLAGPLTREQIKILTKEQKKAQKAAKAAAAEQAPAEAAAQTGEKVHLLPFAPKPGIPLDFIYDNRAGGGSYSPFIFSDGEVIFDEQRLGLYIRKNYYISAPLEPAIDWRKAAVSEEEPEYSDEPLEDIAGYEPFEIKLNFTQAKRLQSSLKDFLFGELKLELFINKKLNLVSTADETKEAFLQRCRDVVEKMIDKEVEKVKESYERRIDRIENRIEKEKMKIEQLQQDHKSKRTEELISAGETILGMLLGGRKSRRGFSSAARKRRTTSSAATRVKLKKERVSQLDEDLLEIQEELEDKIADTEDAFYDKADAVEPFEVRLEKNDIIISRQAILWKLS